MEEIDFKSKEWGDRARMRMITNIAEVMAKKGVSQKELSEMLGMNPAALNKIILGKTNPGLDTVIRIAAAIGMDVCCVPYNEEQRCCGNCRHYESKDGENICKLRTGRNQYIQLDMRCKSHTY